MLQCWTMYIIVDSEVVVAMKQTCLLKTKQNIRQISTMTLIFQLASVLHRILIRAKVSLQFLQWPLGVSLSLRIG